MFVVLSTRRRHKQTVSSHLHRKTDIYWETTQRQLRILPSSAFVARPWMFGLRFGSMLGSKLWCGRILKQRPHLKISTTHTSNGPCRGVDVKNFVKPNLKRSTFLLFPLTIVKTVMKVFTVRSPKYFLSHTRDGDTNNRCHFISAEKPDIYWEQLKLFISFSSTRVLTTADDNMILNLKAKMTFLSQVHDWYEWVYSWPYKEWTTNDKNGENSIRTKMLFDFLKSLK